MCGIIGYVGERNALPVLLEGLKRLEYRGYDSAGIAVMGHNLQIIKRKGKVSELEGALVDNQFTEQLGIGHTRWATHGQPNDINAHPHVSMDESIAVVHNGIIENFHSLKEMLEERGYKFKSATDTEVLAHLIQEIRDSSNFNLEEATKEALRKVVGAYAVVVLDRNNPGIVIGARKSSPLVIGLGDTELFIASDITPIAQYTDQFIFLEDNQVVRMEYGGKYEISNLDDSDVQPVVQNIDIQLEQLEKGGFSHFMIKEIFQQENSVADSMRGRLNYNERRIKIGGLDEHLDLISNARRIIFVGCGTSWHTGLIAEYLFEELVGIPCEVEYASEFRYRNPIIDERDVVIAISQSGETADTLAALKLAKERGSFTYGIVNVVGSSIARETHSGSYIHAGPEIGVASTKAFTGQMTVLVLMAIQLGAHRGVISEERKSGLMAELSTLPQKIGKILQENDKIKYIASEIKSASNALYLGRGYDFPVALEGALKLKEISYIHAEGYPAAEMKHGPIALIDIYMPVIVLGTNVRAYDKVVSNIEEVKARKGLIISIINENDKTIRELSDFYIPIPKTEEILSPIISVIPLQLLAYHIAVMRGCDVDHPRNLAKSVTVE